MMQRHLWLAFGIGLLAILVAPRVRALDNDRRSTFNISVAQTSSETEGEMGARQIYGMCSQCHGLSGRGGGIVASLKDSKLSDEEFVKIVVKGRPGTPMRPYKGLLTEKQILAVRAYIRTLPD